ncbi:MAG: WD40 repeat domain-containing protein, partial [Xenococcus sp. (in: cyanobacteria)]
ELITLCRDEPKRERFLQLLAGALRAKELSKKLHILLTLRFEFEPQIRDLNKDKYEEADWQKAWQELWQNGRFLVTPMDREELQQVIEEPAAQRALFFESPKLVNDLIDEVVQMPGALPLLSFTLSELYLEYLKAEENGDRNDRTITEADYQEIGGVTRSLTETADKTYRELVEKEKVDSSTIRDIMLRMVASSGGELARRRVPTSELVYPEPKNEQAKKVIKHFITARLLVKEVIKLEDKNQEYVEPVHDALITGWKKIKDWLEEKQEIAEQLSGWNPIKKLLTTSKAPLFLASKENNSERDIKEAEKQLKVNLPLQRDVTTAAFKWEDNEKEAKYLWNASPYLDVLKLVLKSEQNNNWLNQIETEFVKCSVEQKRKNTYIRWGIAIAVILALSGLTILSRYNANIADRRRINADVRAFSLSSKNLLDSNQQLEATIDAIKAGRLLEDNEKVRIEPETQMQAITALQRVVYINRLPNQIELPNFREINRLEKHNSEVRAVSFSNDGAMIATASGDNTIIIWQTDGTLKKTLTGHTDIVRSISFSPDNRTLVSASNDLTLVLWNLDDGTVLRSFKGHTGTIPTVTFSPNGQLIASASADGTIKIWNPEAGLIKTIEKAHPDPVKDGPYVQSVQFSPDGQLLASAGYDGLVKLWTTDGKLIDSFDHGYIVWDISFSPDGQTLASAGQNGKIKLWSRDGTLLRTLKGHLSAVRRVDFSSDGETLASAGQDNTVKIWSKDGTLQFKSLKGHSGWVWDVAFSPVNSELQILASASEDGTVKLWRQEETTLRRLNVGFIPNFIRFSPDGTTIATGNWEGILLWNVENNQVRYLETRSTDNVSFSLDGQILAIAGRHEIKLWNLATNKSKTLEGHKENVSSVLFNPYEKLLASGSWDKTVKLWNFDNLDGHINKFCENKDYVSSLSFSPDGKLLAFGSWDGTVKLWPWNLECQAIETVITHGNRVQDVSFSPDGNMIASASSDNTIKLLTLGETDPRTLRGHNAWVLSLSFHPNGKILATGSSDQTVKLWGIDSGSEIETLKSHTPVEGALGMWPKVSFNPDGKILASTSPGDKTIVLWNFDLKDLLAQACGVAGDYLQTNPNVSEDDRKLCH